MKAGAGNDSIHAFGGTKRDYVDCGKGFDTAYVDKGDRTRRCERVKHARPPATQLLPEADVLAGVADARLRDQELLLGGAGHLERRGKAAQLVEPFLVR